MSQNSTIDASNLLTDVFAGSDLTQSGLATGTIQLSSDLRVVHCNHSAQDLLLGKNYQSRPILELISDAEKFGICATGTSDTFALMLSAGTTQFQFEMRDGRTIMVCARNIGGATKLLELSDVSWVVHNALSHRRDLLTGLATRVELLTRLSQAFDAPRQSAALLYIDLDRFKAVNDTLGRPVGDALLKLVAERISSLLSARDVIARLGGDEFAVLLLDNGELDTADRLAAKLVDLVSRSYLVAGNLVNIGVSVGIAILRQDGTTPDELIKNADLALFQAKSDGRGTYRFFTKDMDRQARSVERWK